MVLTSGAGARVTGWLAVFRGLASLIRHRMSRSDFVKLNQVQILQSATADVVDRARGRWGKERTRGRMLSPECSISAGLAGLCAMMQDTSATARQINAWNLPCLDRKSQKQKLLLQVMSQHRNNWSMK